MAERNNENMEKAIVPRKKSNNTDISAKRSDSSRKSGSAVTKTANKSPVRKSELHAVRAPRVINVKKKDKKPFPWSVVFVAVILTAMFLFMMMNYAEVDKYRSEITDLNGKITSMQKTQNTLEVKLSNRYNLSEIEEYAANELGMVKKDQLNSHYITVEQEDKVEMYSYDDGEEGGMGFLLNGLGEVWRDFFNRSSGN